MEHAYIKQLQHILEHMTVGVAILDCPTLRVIYANTYMASLAADPWRTTGLAGRLVSEVLPVDIYQLALPLFASVYERREKIILSDIPYEGFLETRGRTYWRISLEPASPTTEQELDVQSLVVVTLEDLTSSVRSRLQLEVIHHISAAIAGHSPLHDVLDRILLAMQELVGSKRCAVLLIDEEETETTDAHFSPGEDDLEHPLTRYTIPIVRVVAQQGLYEGAEDWHPRVSEQLLLHEVMLTRQALVVQDTSRMPTIDFPILDDYGQPRRPGSVVCVPILETLPEGMPGAILGTIEVYHRRARGLPIEEVHLLEQFAPQAGLAIQNARLFQRLQRLARVANQQAHQLENVMRAIPDGVIIYDASWRLLEINHAARRLMGWSDEEIGLHINTALARSKATFPQSSPAVSDLIADMETRPEDELQPVDEFEMVGADGQSYTMRRSKAAIHDSHGQIFAYVVVYHDVTRQAMTRRRIEQEVKARTAELAQRNADLQETQATLQLYNDRLKLLLERLPAGVMLISLDSQQVTLTNNQATRLLERVGVQFVPVDGVSSQQTLPDAVGMKIEDLLASVIMYDADGNPVPYEGQPLYRALYRLEGSEAEFHTFQTDGQSLNLLVNAAPLLVSNGAADNIVLVWQDITWIKALERAREDFFHTMAHELKTPLANIRAHLSALQARDMVWSSEKQQDFLLTADEQVERLVRMINHFLDASRVEAGALRPEIEPILLPEMFEDLQERLEALISSSQRRLDICLPDQLPAVLGDYELIMSVLTNLLSNAFHHAPPGDTVHLEAALSKPGAETPGVTLRVIDRGPGLTPEQQAGLFIRFSSFTAAHRQTTRYQELTAQAHTPGKRWSPTTGLGLYISKGIIEAHGSTLEVQSTPGEGAIFAFTLALARQARSEAG
jgi:PAS domain S-box-containing protein